MLANVNQGIFIIQIPKLMEQIHHAKVKFQIRVIALACHEKCSSSWCVGPESDDCIICDEHTKYWDLKTWRCLKECDDGFPVETVVYNSEESFSAFRYCRGKMLRIKSRLGFDYYINPASSSNLELGTMSNPFMSLDDAFRELFN